MAEGQTVGGGESAPANKSSVIGTDSVGSGEASSADSFGAEENSSEALSGITEQDVPFLSDAELDTALENESGMQKGNLDEGDESSDDSRDAQTDEDDSQEVTDSKSGEDQDDAEGGKKLTEAELRLALAEKDRQVRDQEAFIQRRNQEYGTLKKHFTEQIEQLREQMQDMTPAEAVEAGGKLNELKTELQKVNTSEASFKHVVNTQKTVFSIIPEPEFTKELVEAMGDEILEAGGDETYVNNFKRNPFLVANAHEIIMLSQTAKKTNMIRALATYVKKLKAENSNLSKKPTEVLKKIENVSKNSRGITGKNAGGTSRADRMANLSEAEIASLSDAELDKMLAESKRLGR